MDVSNLCRSCMKEVASWEKENFNSRAVDMFCFCTKINIAEEDNLPKQFCYDCIIKIESSYTFITEAQKIDTTLKNIVSRTETSIIIEPDNFSFHKTHAIDDNQTHDIVKLTLPDYKVCSTIDSTLVTITDDLLNDNNFNTSHDTEQANLEESLPLASQRANILAGKKVRSKKNNVCPVCRKGFVSKVWFNKHMEKQHIGQKYSCQQCSKSFTTGSQLSSHMVCHSDERRFPCGACDKRFKRRKQLAVHARTHADARPYACDLCDMRFKIKSVLNCHMKVHAKDKQYLCCFCGWSFSQACNLRVHMRTHTGDKPYRCELCAFRCAAASSLRRHARAHSRLRPHVCRTCPRAFADTGALARHTRTHSGELPYQCPGCARAFTDSWKRKTHLMRAHRMALQDIPRMRRDGQTIE